MFYRLKEVSVPVGGDFVDTVSFGRGDCALVILPGLTVRSVKGSGAMLAWMYRMFAKDWRVTVIDKKSSVPENCTVKELAEDTAMVMQSLGIASADVVGVSMGGMIAQVLALEHPELVHSLVLAVTLSRCNDKVRQAIETWCAFIEREDSRGFAEDMVERMYSPAYVSRYRCMIPILAKMSMPKDQERFLRLAKACLTCDTEDRLGEIRCPAFVIGGKEDRVVGGEGSVEIADKLGCSIHMYEELGHAAYEEAGDFNRRIYDFLKIHKT